MSDLFRHPAEAWESGPFEIDRGNFSEVTMDSALQILDVSVPDNTKGSRNLKVDLTDKSEMNSVRSQYLNKYAPWKIL